MTIRLQKGAVLSVELRVLKDGQAWDLSNAVLTLDLLDGDSIVYTYHDADIARTDPQKGVVAFTIDTDAFDAKTYTARFWIEENGFKYMDDFYIAIRG